MSEFYRMTPKERELTEDFVVNVMGWRKPNADEGGENAMVVYPCWDDFLQAVFEIVAALWPLIIMPKYITPEDTVEMNIRAMDDEKRGHYDN